jgi:PIN domain nuclease of toxin-antitoxin system
VRLLLDTHVWLWQMLDSARLSPAAAEALGAPEHELYLSSISAWEFLVLVRNGRLSVEGDPVRWLRTALRRSPLKVVGLDLETAIRSEQLEWSHKDPADRFLVATALVNDMTLLTADRRIREYTPASSLW